MWSLHRARGYRQPSFNHEDCGQDFVTNAPVLHGLSAGSRGRLRKITAIFVGFGIIALAAAVFMATEQSRQGGTPYQERVTEVAQLDASGVAEGPKLSIDAVIRDFTDDHPDFEMYLPTAILKAATGLLHDKLGDDNKPRLKNGSTWIQSPASFHQWYNDDPKVNRKVHYPLVLAPSARGTLVADHDAFFPIDGRGWADETLGHNFWFTLELHHSFIYHGGERFTFRGDDDLWVFINKSLALDLGGVHVELEKTIVLDDLGLNKGQRASLDIFYAERHTMESHFRIETTIKLWEEPCQQQGAEFPYIMFRSLTHSNLGGFGPDSGEEILVYRAQAFRQGHTPQDVELHVRVKPGSNYTPAEHQDNGLLHSSYGAIGFKSGCSTSLLFSFHDPATQALLELDDVSLTFFNLHLDPGDDESAQYIEAAGYDTRTLMSHTEVTFTKDKDMTRFSGTRVGTMQDEPANPAALSLTQQNRIVTLGYNRVQMAELTLGTTVASNADTRFVFVAKPSLLCAAMGVNPEADNIPVISGLPTRTTTTSRWLVPTWAPTTTVSPSTTTTSSFAARVSCAILLPWLLGLCFFFSESQR